MVSQKRKIDLTNGSLDISVVAPVKNEAKNLEKLCQEICETLRGREFFEVIYVDDGSCDDTVQVIHALKAKFSELRAFRHKEPSGQSAAIVTGVKMAKGNIIVTLDGDGQNDPADIPKLLAGYRNKDEMHSSLIIGHRVTRRDSRVKRASSRLANTIRSSLLEDKTVDTGCGLKVISRELFLSLPEFDHMHRFLPALVIRSGGDVLSLPVNHRIRSCGESKYGTWDRLWVGIVDLFGMLWLKNRKVNPEIVSLEDYSE